VGRLSREKGHIDMIAALQYLRQMQPSRDVRLIIVGEGPEQLPLAQAIHSAGLDKHVVFAGQLKDVAPYYEAADVVAIPSLSEGSPNVLLEAMAYAVPVVATRVGGIPEIVTDGETALLVPPRHPVAMAKAIDRLFSNSRIATNMGQLARKKVEEDYSPESRAKALLDIYTAAYRLVG
jgi:L-malate glycosyltransferase